MSESNLSNEITNLLNELTTEDNESALISQVDAETIIIEEETYLLVEDYREGFELDAFKARYQPFFEKFDFIVGDWGHEQLRLRGFYQINQSGVPYDQTIDLVEDYLLEYCNFGCRYFVLGKQDSVEEYKELYPKYVDKMPKLNRRMKPKTKTGKKINPKKGTITKNKAQKEKSKKSRKPFKMKDANTQKNKQKKTKATNKQANFTIRMKTQ
ncbi:YutD family protein [Aerococcaceae bacterium DSM 111020]|nr:YutD family protein [Aerococcaceae bacterium DSM 111020]